ncbi:Hypothetical protein NTJ_06887 [Nesidiocoris tenuis]|uniref:Uncharacterized protein n=1 Tax=Nesidiocoris tenuis TaxID=355587 RepID=A0ABN7APD6_9HEMI|nr:Hypothetical protein NTJ_06887 [Nesidiocoris tenuis]
MSSPLLVGMCGIRTVGGVWISERKPPQDRLGLERMPVRILDPVAPSRSWRLWSARRGFRVIAQKGNSSVYSCKECRKRTLTIAIQ